MKKSSISNFYYLLLRWSLIISNVIGFFWFRSHMYPKDSYYYIKYFCIQTLYMVTIYAVLSLIPSIKNHPITKICY